MRRLAAPCGDQAESTIAHKVAARETIMKADRSEPMMEFKQHLKRCDVSLKPASKRTGVEAWFPYYAGYSSEFVRQALLGLGARPGWTVLDPWNGSGTTTAVSDNFGCDAIGFDINPVAALVAAARLTRAEDAAHSSGLAAEFISLATRNPMPLCPADPLLAWLSPRLTRRYRQIEGAVLDLLGSKAGVRVDIERVTPPPFAAFFLLCLIRAAKRFTRMKDNSNPTWVTPERRGDAYVETFDRTFLSMVAACSEDAERAQLDRSSSRPTTSAVRLADARGLPVPEDSVDAVITSPPYCTRVDYFRATLFELAAIGISPDGDRYRQLRSKAMGTNLMRKDYRTELDLQPDEIRRLLKRIQKHPSKASATYYYQSFAQYFDDARRALYEIRRVLKPQATAVIVVQSSYYKDVRIRLGDLYVALGASVGLESRVVHRVPVRRVLATINPRATRHEPDRQYTEDVVALHRLA